MTGVHTARWSKPGHHRQSFSGDEAENLCMPLQPSRCSCHGALCHLWRSLGGVRRPQHFPLLHIHRWSCTAWHVVKAEPAPGTRMKPPLGARPRPALELLSCASLAKRLTLKHTEGSCNTVEATVPQPLHTHELLHRQADKTLSPDECMVSLFKATDDVGYCFGKGVADMAIWGMYTSPTS